VRWYRTGVIPCDILVPHIDSRVKKPPRNGRIFEMINECTSNLLKHLEKTFSKASNCLENKIQKTNCIQKSIKIYFFYFRCWSVLTPYDPFYLGIFLGMVTSHALNNTWAKIQKEYWCLIWNMNMQSASSIWSNL
jgi:hypothetical protein